MQVVSDFWKDFTASHFSKHHDRLALVTLRGSNTLLKHFVGLLDCARAARDGVEFAKRLATEGLISNNGRALLQRVAKDHWRCRGRTRSRQADIWPFLCTLHVLSLDLHSSDGTNGSAHQEHARPYGGGRRPRGERRCFLEPTDRSGEHGYGYQSQPAPRRPAHGHVGAPRSHRDERTACAPSAWRSHRARPALNTLDPRGQSSSATRGTRAGAPRVARERPSRARDRTGRLRQVGRGKGCRRSARPRIISCLAFAPRNSRRRIWTPRWLPHRCL